jgi:hypothetical protein
MVRMKQKLHWLLPVIFIMACNNDKKTEQTQDNKPVSEHATHTMTASSNGYCDSVNSGLITEDTLKGSPHRTAMATVNKTHVHIEYGSPGVKGRVIWGGLVAYDKVWVAGAHKATTIQFSKDVEINSKKIPAGKYAFFTITGKDKWTVILNTKYDQHLADDYNEKEDVLRVDLTPETHNMIQRLTYSVKKIDDQSGEIVMQWERLQIRVGFNLGSEH